MATYVFSDVHGHRAPLERLLERVSPTDDDRIFMLGDMVDRGPDPVGVLKVCRGLKNAQVLMGNHEDLMMAYFQSGDEMAALNWGINGSETTIDGLGRLRAVYARRAAGSSSWRMPASGPRVPSPQRD